MNNVIGKNPLLLNSVGRGAFSDDCMDTARMTNAYLLSLDAMSLAILSANKTPNTAIDSANSIVNLLDSIEVSKTDKPKSDDVSAATIIANDMEQLEFLKLQLTHM